MPGRNTRNTTYRCILPDLAGLRDNHAAPSRRTHYKMTARPKQPQFHATYRPPSLLTPLNPSPIIRALDFPAFDISGL